MHFSVLQLKIFQEKLPDHIYVIVLSFQPPGRYGTTENSKDQSDDCHTDPGGWKSGFLQHRDQERLNTLKTTESHQSSSQHHNTKI